MALLPTTSHIRRQGMHATDLSTYMFLAGEAPSISIVDQHLMTTKVLILDSCRSNTSFVTIVLLQGRDEQPRRPRSDRKLVRVPRDFFVTS